MAVQCLDRGHSLQVEDGGLHGHTTQTGEGATRPHLAKIMEHRAEESLA